jgi:hypothetical protein
MLCMVIVMIMACDDDRLSKMIGLMPLLDMENLLKEKRWYAVYLCVICGRQQECLETWN